ncbi:hypothetical protein TVAG_125880 [Trichomonas vaginalis G3]|uniref:Uncharacterized protein n=1 Tax=Trichomonas vaginalis (strain ATCC PRA-98 / G3) TaxID=412133 RepID=A2ET95_TRIV3|nr:hypothetical protein TVAGG3_0190450 [Trichomonas vaginalis G3]EAY04148.1 hypothetical protein TVAG_125880 [Trichomonas vaginalis G3]KAI5549929.1 hypothetical protein TVAGG3_0190450 [Trichomonas vaginalis G3]|eukprot:XP_001316371.1 hypothetical protein [Trichomonas vaginalis G3]
MKSTSQEEWMKIVQTFSKAIYSSLAKEKNIMIRELMTIFNDFDEKLNRTLKNNAMKQEMLEKGRDLLKKQTVTLEDAKRKSDIIKIAEQNTNPINNEKLASQILALEKEIKRYTPNYQTSKIDKSKNCLYLIDTKLKRLEDLSYTLLKRSVVVDEGNEVTDQINSEFGSILGLLQSYHTLTEENEMLKQQERNIGLDSLSKRRPFSQLTTLCVQTLSILFQNDLKSHEYAASKLRLKFEDCDSKDFDELSQDKSFLMNKNDLESMKKQLEEINQEISDRSDEVRKITAQVDTAMAPLIKNRMSTKTLTVDKLSAMCEHLISQLSVNRKKNEQLNNDIEAISKQILQIEEEKNNYAKQYINLFAPIFQLLDAHDAIYANMYGNKQRAKTLQAICSAFGLDLFYQRQTYKDAIIPKQVMSRLNTSPTTPKIISPQVSTNLLSMKQSGKSKVLIKPSTSVRQKMVKIPQQKSTLSIRLGSQFLSNSIEEVPSAPPELLPDVTDQSGNPEEKKQINEEKKPKQNVVDKFINFFLLTDIHKLASHLDSKIPDTSEAIKEFRTNSLQEIHKTAEESMKQYLQETSAQLQQIRQLSQLILVKEKASISTQIDPIPFVDVETMTEQHKKGKK